MSNEKPMPAPGQRWRFNGTAEAPASGPHVVTSLRWFGDRVEALFTGHACAGVEHMMRLDACEYLGPDASVFLQEAREALIAAGYSNPELDAVSDDVMGMAAHVADRALTGDPDRKPARDRAFRKLCALYLAITEET